MNASLKRAGAVILSFKAIYLGLVTIALVFWGRIDEGTYLHVNQRWPREGTPVFASHFATWDAAHYLFLSEVGYRHGVPSCAFYPAWPLAMRAVGGLAGNHILAGVLLSNFFSVIALLLLFEGAATQYGGVVAGWTVAFCLAFPGSLFFQFVYSESLFIFLSCLLWWSLSREKYEWSVLAAFLMPLTRAVGVFSVLPIAWHFGTRLCHCSRGSTRAGDAGCLARGGRRGMCMALTAVGVAPVAGWTCYLALMALWTGNSFEGYEAQRFWRVHSAANLWDMSKFVNGFFSPTAWHAFYGSMLDRAAFLLVLACLPCMWRLDVGLVVWTVALGIVPAMSGTFTSFVRFAAVVFPLFLALGKGMTSPDGRKWKWIVLGSFALLHGVLLWRFVNFRWAG